MAFTFFGAIQEKPQYKINKPIRLIECFAGIGTQAMALRNLGANFKRYRAYDFDKDAVKSYNAIHNTNFEPTDICNVKGKDLGITEKDKYEYIFTYSFPCTSLSCSGKQEGMKKGLEKGIEKGIEKGKEAGRAEGKAEGIEETKRDNARKMKALGATPEFISQVTGLSAEEIEALL